MTEYPDSSEYDSPLSSVNENNGEWRGRGRRKKPTFPAFNTKTEMHNIEPQLGTRFANPNELKDALTKYAVAKGYPIKFDKNDKTRVLAICGKGCSWRLYATYMQSEKSFQIKSYLNEHKCIRSFRLPNCWQRFMVVRLEVTPIRN